MEDEKERQSEGRVNEEGEKRRKEKRKKTGGVVCLM